MSNKNLYLDGMMGLVVGDALGCPVEFVNREELQANPVENMEEYGTFNMPRGTWTDDSSLALATLDALRYGYEVERIQNNFLKWLTEGKYTPAGITFDVGATCEEAIINYEASVKSGAPRVTGLDNENNNGNGSLMRILPICIYMYEQQQDFGIDDFQAISVIHEVSSLTHAHIRSKIACGIYYFIVKEVIRHNGELIDCLQSGVDKAVDHYKREARSDSEMAHFKRIEIIDKFRKIHEDNIRSTGYVVDSLEASVWCLATTNTFKDALLKAVNLGNDTDTIAAITGGIAGLYYGYNEIPRDWLESIQRREWIEKKCLDLNKTEKEKVSLK